MANALKTKLEKMIGKRVFVTLDREFSTGGTLQLVEDDYFELQISEKSKPVLVRMDRVAYLQEVPDEEGTIADI